jgi:hypothetical protein
LIAPWPVLALRGWLVVLAQHAHDSCRDWVPTFLLALGDDEP